MQETLIGCLIGAFITWLVSWVYYKKAGDDLKQKSENLENQTRLILEALEQAGFVELKRENGVITGFKRWIVRPDGWGSSVFGNAGIRNFPP
jgi:hypothetical protein